MMGNAEPYAVIDFETTGLSPAQGARPTEIAIVLVQDGKIVDRYSSLMNPGVPIPGFIQELTGISNEMVRAAPGVREVMQEAIRFSSDFPLVAHNASFDRKFWEYEARSLHVNYSREFVCTLLLSRRVFPRAPNHKLATLVDTLGLPCAGRYHRADADAEAAAHLLTRVQEELHHRFKGVCIDANLLRRVQKVNRNALERCVRSYQGRM